MKRFTQKIVHWALFLLIPAMGTILLRSGQGGIVIHESNPPTETFGGEAARFNFEMTKDPALGYPPVERMLTELERIRSFKAGLKTETVPNFNWTELGPDNAGGRTRAVMFDPNDPEGKKVWVGGVTGGMWYNNDITQPESRWTKVPGFIDNLTVSCIAYDPDNKDVFYAGTGEKWYLALSIVKSDNSSESVGAFGNEVYQSIDGGETWSNIDIPGADIQFVHKILVSGDMAYVGTEQGLFVLNQSLDNWSQVLTDEVTDLQVDKNGVIYAAAINAGTGAVLYKNDAGTFVDITPSLLSSQGAGAKRVAIAIAPSDPDVIYVLGATWPQPNSNVVVFISTTNGGLDWSDITVPQMFDGWGNYGGTPFIAGQDFGWGAAGGHMVIAVNPEDPMELYAAAIDLYRSPDGGQTWGESGDGGPISHWNRSFYTFPNRTPDPSLFFNPSDMHGDIHEILFRPDHPEQMVFGTDGGVWFTHDVTPEVPVFDPRNLGLNITQFYTVGANNIAGSKYIMGGTQDNGVQTIGADNFVFPASNTDQGGLQAGPLYQGDGAYALVDQDNSDYQFYSFQNSNLRYSIDGGKNFYFLQNSGLGEFVNPMDYDSQNNTLYATGLASFGGIGVRSFFQRIKGFENISPSDPGNFASSVDLTAFITLKIGANRVSAIKLSPYTANRAFIGTSPGYTPSNTGVYIVDNMDTRVSEDVTNVTALNTILPHNWISCIEIGASDNNLLVTFSNYGVQSVWETQDGGVSWQDKEGNLPDVPIRWALYNPNNRNQAIVATELGIWYTEDISVTIPVWEQVPDLESVRVDMLRYRPADGMIFAATHGRGLWSSDIWATTSIANFTVSNKVGYINQPIQFSDRSIGTQATYLWDFGDSQNSTEKNPVHQYQNAGQYTVSLTINSGADQAVQTNLISILPDKTPGYSPADGGDFESNPGDFAAETTHGFYGTTSSTKFELGNSAIPGKDGVVSGANAYVLNLNLSGYDSLVSVHLYSPNFDFSSGGGYTLSFSAKYDFAEGFDGFIVEYSIDRGANWTPLEDSNSSNWYDKAVKPASFSTFNKGELFFSGTSTGFEEKQADISFLAETPDVAFRFTVRSNDQDSGAGRPGLVGANHAPPYVGLAIDDFKINLEAISVDFETATLTGCTGSTLTFSDLSTAAAGTTLDSFDWDFGVDATPTTATGQGPHDVTYSTTGLKTITLTVNGNVTKTKTNYVEIVDQILNQVTVTSTTMESCPGSYANIILENAESGAIYQLIDATTNDLLGEVTGVGTISIDIGPLDQSITIKVVGVPEGSACTLEMDEQVSIVITDIAKPVITQSGETLTSSAGDSYQWFLDGQPISGATSQSFITIFIGEYLVQVTTNSCTVISDAFIVLVVGLADQELGSPIELYPNPASSWLTLQTSDALADIVSLTIINTSGEMIKRFENLNLSGSLDYAMDIASIPSGLYFLTIELPERKIVKKFIKY